MAKRTNRVVWGLVGVTAVLLVGGRGRLCGRYLMVLPRQEREFGLVSVEEGIAGAPPDTWKVTEGLAILGLWYNPVGNS